jgi:maltose O-acetyltransferase
MRKIWESSFIKNKHIRSVLHWPKEFVLNYLNNNIVNRVPSYKLRHFFYRNILGICMNEGSSIHMRVFIDGFNVSIGCNSVVNRDCYLDGRGVLIIGNNVSISPSVKLITVTHNYNSPLFVNVFKKIVIEDYVWIGTGVIVLPGVTVGRGAVIAAGSIVSKSVNPYTIVAGNPAVQIGVRSDNLLYNPKWFPPFD